MLRSSKRILYKGGSWAGKKVWAFAHLTIQEFTAAIWQKSTPWTDQCLSVRYLAHSDENFLIFRMVLRFLCGLLSELSPRVLTILYKVFTPQVILDLPMYHQLGYDFRDFSILPYTGWTEFTEKYILLNPILFETNLDSIINCIKIFFPNSISIYLDRSIQRVSPNEWICFVQSLKLLLTYSFFT